MKSVMVITGFCGLILIWLGGYFTGLSHVKSTELDKKRFFNAGAASAMNCPREPFEGFKGCLDNEFEQYKKEWK